MPLEWATFMREERGDIYPLELRTIENDIVANEGKLRLAERELAVAKRRASKRGYWGETATDTE